MKSLLLILAVAAAANACRFPSYLWCSSKDIATECKVYEQCKESEWTVDTRAPLVSVGLYYETLCPFCQHFVTKQLAPTFSKIAQIMNVTLVPYGNANEKRSGDKWKFFCQHGKKECAGNMLETCAMHTLGGDMKKIVPFVSCMELEEHPMIAVKKCAEKQKVDLDSIMSCFNGSLGNQLEHQMALDTEALRPKQTYTPWIVLNGVHTDEINKKAQTHLLKLVCTIYKGPKPPACKQTDEEKSVCLKE